MIWKVPKIWDGGECWIIGGGPSMPRQFGIPEVIINDVCTRKLTSSAYSNYLTFLHDKHVIGVNNAYQIGTWIDVLFFGDRPWYMLHERALANWPGMKVTCCQKFANKSKDKMQGIKFLARDKTHAKGLTEDRCKVSWNNNSGAASINLAVHFGVRRIMLLGYDMTLDSNKYSHWHGSHRVDPRPNKKIPPFDRHLKGFPLIAEDAKRLNVEILNVNLDSAIDVFPKVKLSDII